MDGQRVKGWEARCVEEQPPACVTACPLHVDVRAMLEKMKAGDFVAAFAVYTRVVPFPAILSHICDHPCEAQCRRAEAGGAIRIAALERACVEEALGALRRAAQTNRKPKRIAVVGAGLAGLTAAFDLAMKGHRVTVFEADAHPLERLVSDYAAALPSSAIDVDLGALTKLGVEIRCRSRIVGSDGPLGLDTLIATHDAALLALGPGPALDFASAVRLTDAGRIAIDPNTRATSHPKVFGGGFHGAPGEVYSPIGSVADGRRAAASIDRFLQGASLTASRADDGAAASCLYVNVAAHDPMPPVEPSAPDHGYDRAEAIAEAARCFPCRCMECVKACEYLKHYGAYPKRYVRDIYNNVSIVMGVRKANRMIDSCTLCGLCETICPNDLAMGEVCLEARRTMVETGHMPASHHDFALRDMAYGRSEAAAFARHQPGHSSSAMLFFPGCQLSASSPEHVERIYAHLTGAVAGGVGLMVDCCGAPAHWAGRRDLHDEVKAGLQQTWESFGRPQIVTACSTCLKMFGDFHPEMKARSLWSVIAEIGWPDGPRPALAGPLAIHDPCTGRHASEVQRAVRDLAARLGADVRELSGAELTTCCGFGGLASFANPELADRIVDRRIEESAHDYLTYCAMCRDNFARRGKRAVHLLDLVYPAAEGADPAARPDPGFSRRRDNRARLIARLLRQLWGEDMNDPVPEIDLIVPESVRAAMERKLILVEDVARVVAHAEATGKKLKDKATGHIVASLKVGAFTCWVEYEAADGKFIVHRAYGHRMQVEAKP
ncbi:MAG: pyridine nucleotide-disulfide oxidoreductase/dicluster-binding protein [Roseiarcus sp.]